MSHDFYLYRAHVTRVLDGDTIVATINYGFNGSLKLKCRLLYINTPEIPVEEKRKIRNPRNPRDYTESEKNGILAKKYTTQKLLGKDVIIRTKKKGSFGRWLATIWSENSDLDLRLSFNANLIRENHAVFSRASKKIKKQMLL